MEDQLAARRGRVEALAQGAEAHPVVLERVHQLDDLLDRTPEPVELPHHQDVTLAAVVEGGLELGPPLLPAAYLIL